MTPKEDYYDQVLPKEPKFMAPIRRWEKRMGFVTPIIWTNTIIIILLHVLVPGYIVYLLYNGVRCLRQTLIFGIIYAHFSGLGTTAGAHRLWAHRSYKTNTPLKILLLFFYSTSGLNSVYNWVRDHRVHHKKSETSGDPHDSNRGFFFAHIGWLMMKKHPHVIEAGRKIDMSDITGDPILVFYNRYFSIFKFLFRFYLPIMLPVWWFGEELYISIMSVFAGYIFSANATFSVNSFAHLYGMKPYDKYTFFCFVVFYIQIYTMNNSKIITEEKNQPITPKEDYYDQVLPKEPKFMAPIRRWEKRMGFVTPIIWTNAIAILLLHVLVLGYTFYLLYNGVRCLRQTFFFEIIYGNMAGLGITAGIHRLWSHRCYKVNTPLQILLLCFFSATGQNSVYDWVRDHRVHHKKSETSGDPHDSSRGFFFAHIGWLMMKKHPHVIETGKKIDMSDITDDPILAFHTRYFIIFKFLFRFYLPTMIPVWWFGEELYISVLAMLVSYLLNSHITFCVNSFAHLYGYRPYDKTISPSENIGVSIIALGEGWHNYHHSFPWDYRSSEFPYYINITTILLHIAAYFGFAYDFKIASPSVVKSVVDKKGDKSHLRFISAYAS